jgi:hypothetical protein
VQHPYVIKTHGTRDQHLNSFLLIEIGNFFKLYVLRLNPIFLMPKSIKDQRSTINLPKCSLIDSHKKVMMSKVYWVLAINDMLIVDKMIVLTFLNFPDPIKRIAHRLSMISLIIFSMSILLIFCRYQRGSAISWVFVLNNLRKTTLPSVDVVGASMVRD